MIRDKDGYFTVKIKNISEGTRYFFQPGGKESFPDPASHFQPEGVYGPSEIVDHSGFVWNDQQWKGLPLSELIIYELHIGTFTGEGSFEAVIPFLKELADLGITALEIMPVAQFPGSRNWGYDGAYPYAVQNTYGGPAGLKKLVDAAHLTGLAVILDVVYNHIGPEGNYLSKFGPYFTGKYKVPWGDAINYDDEWSDGVREYFSFNALHWFENYHFDGLRIDAIHTMYDSGAVHFWELTRRKLEILEQRMGRKLYLFAESDLNSPRVIKDLELGGYGFDAQWLDDYHHALYVLLHPEGHNRYEDFGSLEQLAKAYTDGFVHSGEFVKFRKRKHGKSSAGIPGYRFIAFNQNHDQVGNRVLGERLGMLTGFGQLKMAAAALLLSPYLPLIFMGEEYADENPFFYFVSHTDEKLIEAVRDGRKKEFEAYKWDTEPPDPQGESTFAKSKIHWQKRYTGRNKMLLDWNKELIRLRKNRSALRYQEKDGVLSYVSGNRGFCLVRSNEENDDHILSMFNFSDKETELIAPMQIDIWHKILDSLDPKWSYQENEATAAPEKLKAGNRIVLGPWSVAVFGQNKHDYGADIY
jgi:maltooligosyltrehalose trehalohydrolase